MELANILELIHAVSDSDLTEFNPAGRYLKYFHVKRENNCTADGSQY